jgi:hypothetical protein
MILVPLLNPKFATVLAEKSCELRVRGTSSFAEAEAIAKEDPLHKAGLRTFTLQKWRANEGRITVTVDFSDQTMKIE